MRLLKRRNGMFEAKYGYIDHSGVFRNPAVFEDAGPFSEGVAWVVSNSKVGYIDKNGSILVQPQL